MLAQNSSRAERRELLLLFRLRSAWTTRPANSYIGEIAEMPAALNRPGRKYRVLTEGRCALATARCLLSMRAIGRTDALDRVR